MGKTDFVTEEFLDKRLSRLEKKIIGKLNLIIKAFDRPLLEHEKRIGRVENHLGLPPYAS